MRLKRNPIPEGNSNVFRIDKSDHQIAKCLIGVEITQSLAKHENFFVNFRKHDQIKIEYNKNHYKYMYINTLISYKDITL